MDILGVLDGRVIEPHQDKVLRSMESYLMARFEKKTSAQNEALKSYKTSLLSYPGERVDYLVTEKKVSLTKLRFTISLIFYLLGFILLGEDDIPDRA